MGTPAEELEAKLAQFERQFPTEGAQLRAVVTGSPELSAMLKTAIEAGHLDGGFLALSTEERDVGTLGTYKPGSEAISLPMDLLAGKSRTDVNTLLITLGHEMAHAINKDALAKRYEQFGADLAAVASGPPPRDYTSTIKGYLDELRAREAHDEIGGVNVLAAKIARENPGASKEQLYRALFESTKEVHGYVDASGTGADMVYTPGSGITFNDKFQIEPNAAHVEAFGQHFFDALNYPKKYGERLINLAGDMEAKAQAAEMINDPKRPAAPATVDLRALGIDPSSIALPSGIVDVSSPRLASPEPLEADPASPQAATPTTDNPQPSDPEQATIPKHPASAPLLPATENLLQDSERFVRQIAAAKGLPWDGGMENTVAAVACCAKEAGMSGITHFKATNGALQFAQHDGFALKEANLDANTAANTPVEVSRDRLNALDLAVTADGRQATKHLVEHEVAHTR